MFCSLIKKVNISKSEKLYKIGTNKETNFIAIGGSNGFVQIVDLDVSADTKKDKGSQISFNQSLKYHNDDISLLTWNDNYNKLTTCDKSGVIVVWKFVDNKWETEMINNREQSTVTDIKWNRQGQYLCFIYEDGHAIVGTVDGNRSWGNDIRNSLYLIEWSPDGTILLLASRNQDITILTSSGQQLGVIEIDEKLKNVEMASICWWSKYIDENKIITLQKHLMLAFVNGDILLYDDENDMNPIYIKSNLNIITKAEWNVNGDAFAICGFINEGDTKGCLSLYNSNGDFIKLIKINEPIVCLSFNSKGTQIALETQSTIYFGIVKQDYKWCYFEETLVYAYLSDKEHHTVTFWNTKNNTYTYKYVKNMLGIVSCSPFCLITAKIDKKGNYLLILSNSIGSPVNNKIINIEPNLISINSTHVVVSDGHYIYLWQFRGTEESSNNKDKNDDKTIIINGEEISINLLTNKMMKELCFFIDDKPNNKDMYNLNTFKCNKKTKDPITCISMTDNYLFIVCKSGKGIKYNLLSLAYEKFMIEKSLIKIGMNPTGRYLWTINDSNNLNIWDLEENRKLDFDKKDIWTLVWSENNNSDLNESDDQLNFAYMEKNKLNIIKDLKAEEILDCNGYLAQFNDMSIISIKLDDLLFKPYEEKKEVDDIVIKIETRALRDLKSMLSSNAPIDEIYKYVDENSSHKLWEIFGKHCLQNLDFINAEKAMLKINDYMGLEFIKRIKNIDDDNLKRAEICQFYEDFDQAENEYGNNDRKDLAIMMRFKLGQWDKVIELTAESGVVQEDNMKMSYDNYAQQFLEEKNYEKAEEYFKKAGDVEGLINIWFKTEDYDKAIIYIDKIPEENELLLFLGSKFEKYGLCDEAVKCYLRYGDVKKAIDTCVLMNKWNLAVDLAEKNNFFQIEGLVNKFGSILLEKGKKMDLVELYRKAHRHTDAAKILMKIAEDLKDLNASPITLKKIYTIAALEMESFKSRLIDAQITNITQQSSIKNTTTLDTLITSDLSNVNDKQLNNPWKGAEAYHFYMLCQSQLYQGTYKEALKTALRLVLYEKELGSKQVYQLIALTSFLNKNYKFCSKALSTLEQLPSLTKSQRQSFKDLAVNIFTRYEPKNRNENMIICPSKNCGSSISEYSISCNICGSNFSPCVVSGQSIFNKGYFKCKRCKHRSLEKEVMKKGIKNCPLCHLPLDLSRTMNDKDIFD